MKSLKIIEMFSQKLYQLKGDMRFAKTSYADNHSPTFGEWCEINWSDLLTNYLPKRYVISNGFLIDSYSKSSEQIDLIIYDRQYSPFILEEKGKRYIPIESLYGFFEIKQTFDKKNLDYSRHKYESVMKLEPTFTSFKHAQGTSCIERKKVLFGMLTNNTKLNLSTDEELIQYVKKYDINYDLLVILNSLFYMRYSDINETTEDIIDRKNPLFAFIFMLNAQLQTIGTVGAMNFYDYYKKNN